MRVQTVVAHLGSDLDAATQLSHAMLAALPINFRLNLGSC